MSFRRLLLPFFLLSTGPCIAQDASHFVRIDTPPNDFWLELGKSTSGAQFFTKGIARRGHIHEFWLKVVSKGPRECRTAFQNPFDAVVCEDLKKTTAEQELSRVEVDCKAKTSRTIGYVAHNFHGEVIDRTEYPKAAWKMIYPDTMMDKFNDNYC